MEEESGWHRVCGFGVALNSAAAESGDQLECSRQCCGGHALAAVSLADEVAGDPPVREVAEAFLVFSAVLDAGHLVRCSELAPAETVLTVEDQGGVGGAGPDPVELAEPVRFRSICVAVVRRVEAHAPAATKDPVVGFDQGGERVPGGLVERSDRVPRRHVMLARKSSTRSVNIAVASAS